MRASTVANLVAALSLLASAAAAQTGVTVKGLAWDSLHKAPLAGASVVVIGTSHTAITDSAGRFAIANVPPGRYRIAAQHDAIDALGMSAIGATAVVTDGRDQVDLFVPSFTHMWRLVCGPTAPAADTGFIFGNVRPAKPMKNHSGIVIAASWIDLATNGKTVAQKLKTLEVNADSSGSYTLCGVPTSTGLSIHAKGDSTESGMFAIDPLDNERVRRRDLRMGIRLDDVVAAGRAATIAGKVVADSGGGPLENAEVQFDETPVKVTTKSNGEFSFTDIVPGTYTLHARRIGYAESVMRVDVEEGEKRDVSFVLSKATVLDSVAVSATPLARDQALRGFEEHRKLGLGKFLTRDDLEKAGDRPLSSLLKQFNGLDVVRRGGRTMLLARRVTSFGGSACPVMIYLDGVYYSPITIPDIDEFIPANLEGVEYFSGAAKIPPEYNRLGSPCGVLVLHTRKR